ncbi:MAG: hypothetical protein U5L74_09575 [Ideonella sp.]|nr:hypothetical protein [Ideonella sp.]
MNYSVFNNPDLDEQHLDETKPIGEPAAFGYLTSYYSWGVLFGDRNVSEPIDWNWDGDTLDARCGMEVNRDGFREVLKGKTDWDKLSFSSAFQDAFPEKAAGARPMPSQEELLREPPAKELIKIPPAGPSGLRMEKSDSIKLSWISSSITLRNYRVYRVEANGLRTLLTKVPYKKLPELERIEIVLPASSASSLDDIYVSAVSWYGYESGLMGHGRRYLPPSQGKFED